MKARLLINFGSALVALVATVSPARATLIDDVVVYQNEGNDAVSLGANPGATVNPTFPGSLLFGIVLTDDTPNLVLHTTLQLAGNGSSLADVTLFGLGGQITYQDSFPIPCCIYSPIAGTLTIDFTGGTRTTWQFSLVDPVPEPATVFLTASGLGVAWWRRRMTI